MPIFFVEALYGCAIIDHSNNNLPISCVILLFYNDLITIKNTGFDHAFTRDHWLLADGTDFAWKCHEHCLLLVGYDEENYWFNDPWHDHGVCAQPKELVERCHAAQDSYAVTLRRK